MTETPPNSVRSRAIERSGHRRGASGSIGAAVERLRAAIARKLIALRISPNSLTVAGVVLSGGAAICLLIGAGHSAFWETGLTSTRASWWPLSAALVLTGAFLADLFDGAVARAGNLGTAYGALLDSTLDRVGDLLVFLACAVHFSLAGNITYLALSLTAAANAVLISYVKARAENLIDDCGVGFWQRGERCGLFLFAAYLGHIPAALWILGTLPLLTFLRRIRHARSLLDGSTPPKPAGWLKRLAPWRRPRGAAGYGLCMGLLLAFVISAPLLAPVFSGGGDPLRIVLDGLAGG
jgi:CDP-diacylglycerol--glycerol-3-phosphate 3-phosphatidyltransferase